MINKTNFAIGLLLEAYAENGKVNMPAMLEALSYRVGEVCRNFGTVDKKDDEVLILHKEQKGIPILETVADIAYAAGVKRHYSGNSREDMQEYIRLAEQFEKEYAHIDWNNQEIDDDFIDYMDAIEDFIAENLKVGEVLAFDYPNGTKYEWDNIEVAPCKRGDEGVYQLDDDSETPDFWSVYLHMVTGGQMCIADLPTHTLANQFAEMLNNAVISFKDNGYMPLTRNDVLHRQFNLFIDERIKAAHIPATKAAYEVVKNQFNLLVKA